MLDITDFEDPRESESYHLWTAAERNSEIRRWQDRISFAVNVAPRLFVQDSAYSGAAARKFVRRWNDDFEWLEECCQICGQGPIWEGRPLTLHLDHENGVDGDHRLCNLRFLCPNCHSQTDTYCGRNKTEGSTRARGQYWRSA